MEATKDNISYNDLQYVQYQRYPDEDLENVPKLGEFKYSREVE